MSDRIDLADLGLSPEARSRRHLSLGGSDANTIMSGNSDKLIQLWLEKRGEAPPVDLSDVLAVQMGSYTEPFNAAWFEKQTGYSVESRGLFVEGGPDDLPMTCTLDGIVRAGGQSLGIWEAKHVGVRSTDAEIFERYVPQLTHNCIVTGESHAWLSVFKGNGDWCMFEYALDEHYADAVIEAERDFWRCVQTGEPPAPLPAPKAPKPVGVVEYDMSQSNAWATHAATYVETMLSADRHELAKKELKELVPDDASKAFGCGIEIKRDKRGALRFAKMEN